MSVVSSLSRYAANDPFSRSEADMAPLVWGYKHSRELARRMPAFRGEFATGHPSFPQGSAAAVIESGTPTANKAPDITYSAEDDQAIEEWVRSVGA